MIRILMRLQTSLTLGRCAFISLCVIATFYVKFLVIYQVTTTPQPIDLDYVNRSDYVIRAKGCPRRDKIYMLVLVGSHPDHVQIRDAIRLTWGNPRLKKYAFKLVFIFGKVSSQTQQSQLEAEHHQYGDILEGTFVDSYHNVTIRDLMGLQWAWHHCRHVNFIMRADDDIALDIYKVLSALDQNYVNHKDLIACFSIIKSAIPQRTGRYAVSVEDYPYQYYADYCDGWVYVLTPSVAEKLVQVAPQRKPIWINDVYITGTLIEALGLQHELLYLSFTYSYADMTVFAERYNVSTTQEIEYELGPVRQNVELLLQLQQIYKSKAIREGFVFESR